MSSHRGVCEPIYPQAHELCVGNTQRIVDAFVWRPECGDNDISKGPHAGLIVTKGQTEIVGLGEGRMTVRARIGRRVWRRRRSLASKC